MAPATATWRRLGRRSFTAALLLLGVHATRLTAQFSGRIWYTRVFVRRDGRWQAVAMQHTMVP